MTIASISSAGYLPEKPAAPAQRTANGSGADYPDKVQPISWLVFQANGRQRILLLLVIQIDSVKL